MSSASSKSNIQMDWDLVVPIGPKLAFHCGCVINDILYVHGGNSPHKTTAPSNKFYRMNFVDKIWIEVRTSGSPSLSHHAAISFQNRYMLLIGGWDGQSRSGNVYAYDTVEDIWLHPPQTGFHRDAGLSSHTATATDEGIMVIGREGSLRMQRRFGSAFLLTGSVNKGFNFSTVSRSITSRSGHTANIVNSKLYVIGGRDDELLEYQKEIPGPVTKVASTLKQISAMTKDYPEMKKPPACRKNHVTMSGAGIILMHGGETFDGHYEPVGEMYVIRAKRRVEIVKLGDTKIKRAGHICFSDGENIYIHGGQTGKAVTCGDLLALMINTND